MAIYKITFNQKFSAFEKYVLMHDYDTPQDYFKENADETCLLVQEKIHGLYMVVYRKTSTAVATHPWTRYSWLKQYAPWRDMTQDDWEKAVSEFIGL